MDKKLIENSFCKLKDYIERENFKGYDPYDFLLSKYNLTRFGNKLTFVLSQINKRNPINLRPLFKIDKAYVPKGVGLLLSAYSKLYQINPSLTIRNTMDFLFDLLKKISCTGYSGYCWGYHAPHSTSTKFLPPFTPSIVHTSFVCSGIFNYYIVTKNTEAKEILRSSCDFILNDLPFIMKKEGRCFSYTPIIKDIYFNATMLGSELLAKVYSITKEKRLLTYAKESVDYTVYHQKSNGMWNYRMSLNGREVAQIDFHQGFILNSLFDYMQYSGDYEKRYISALEKGTEFYYKNQFLENGRSIYRWPRKWPVDIHGPAQGIITFSKFRELSPDYFPFAIKIAAWTIENMQDGEGFFYYRKYGSFINKIPFMRWSQSWMFLSLIILIKQMGAIPAKGESLSFCTSSSPSKALSCLPSKDVLCPGKDL